MNIHPFLYPRTIVWQLGSEKGSATALLWASCAYKEMAEQAHAELSVLGFAEVELQLFDKPRELKIEVLTADGKVASLEDQTYLFAIVRDSHAARTAVQETAGRVHAEHFPAKKLDALQTAAEAHFAKHPDEQALAEFRAAHDKAREAIAYVRDNIVADHTTRPHVPHAEQHRVSAAFADIKRHHAAAHAPVHRHVLGLVKAQPQSLAAETVSGAQKIAHFHRAITRVQRAAKGQDALALLIAHQEIVDILRA